MMEILGNLALKVLPKIPKSAFIMYNVIMEKFGLDTHRSSQAFTTTVLATLSPNLCCLSDLQINIAPIR